MTIWRQHDDTRHELTLSAIALTVDRIDDEFVAHVRFGSFISPLKGHQTLETAKQAALDYALQIIEQDAAVLRNLNNSSYTDQ